MCKKKFQLLLILKTPSILSQVIKDIDHEVIVWAWQKSWPPLKNKSFGIQTKNSSLILVTGQIIWMKIVHRCYQIFILVATC